MDTIKQWRGIKEKQKPLFFISLGIYLIISVLNTSLYTLYIGNTYKFILIFCFALLALRELTHRITIKRFKLWVLSGSIVFLSFIGHSGANTILTIIVFSVAASDLEFDSIALFSYRLLLICTLFVVISSQIGIIDDYVYYMAGQPRHYLGFLYALQPAGLMFELVALNLYLHRNRRKNLQLILLIILGVFIWRMTKSRLTFFLEVFMIVFDYIYKKRRKISTNKTIHFFEKISFPLCTGISFYFAFTFENSTWKRALNQFFANRMGLAKESINKYGIHLLGQRISWYGMGLNQKGERTLESVWNGYDWVDNSYIQMFQLYGIIIAILFILVVTISIIRMIKNKRFYLATVIVIYSVYGLIDTACLTLMYNIFWLAIFGAIIEIYNNRLFGTYIKKILT